MLSGRKLLLADDSAAIQKVIDLTFSDEGMNVTTVGDGRSALAELEQYPPPDVILADVFMPEPGGYELCRQIKENERFSQIPVILLVSSFEPFDQAEADRVGADDIVTKPFQSIRQLVNRVGALVGEKHFAGGDAVTGDADAERTQQLSGAMQQDTDETNVTVLVEAPMMETHEAQGPTCAADEDMQTADTRPLERVSDETTGEPKDEWRFEDTMEVEPARVDEHVSVTEVEPEASTPLLASEADTAGDNVEEAINVTEFEEAVMPEPAAAADEPMRQETYSVRGNDEALLDLDDEVLAQEPLSDDVFLDLDFEDQVRTLHAAADEMIVRQEQPEEASIEAAPDTTSMKAMEAPALEAAVYDWSVVTQPIQHPAETIEPSVASEAAERPRAELSSAELQAITHAVIERMSDKVVREIAWEVVPDLAELLIKKRMEEEK